MFVYLPIAAITTPTDIAIRPPKNLPHPPTAIAVAKDTSVGNFVNSIGR